MSILKAFESTTSSWHLRTLIDCARPWHHQRCCVVELFWLHSCLTSGTCQPVHGTMLVNRSDANVGRSQRSSACLCFFKSLVTSYTGLGHVRLCSRTGSMDHERCLHPCHALTALQTACKVSAVCNCGNSSLLRKSLARCESLRNHSQGGPQQESASSVLAGRAHGAIPSHAPQC